MPPQWPQFPLNGQDGPLMALLTSQWPWQPLNSPGATQSKAFGVTLSAQSHLFLQMHLSQGPESCSVLRSFDLCSHHLEKSLSRLFLLLLITSLSVAALPLLPWHSWTCHVLRVSLSRTSVFRLVLLPTLAPLQPLQVLLCPHQEAQRGVGNRAGENPPFMSSLGMEIKIGGSLVSKYSIRTVLNSRIRWRPDD